MKRTLDANAVKTIAVIAMTIDHIAWVLFPGYPHSALPVLHHITYRITHEVEGINRVLMDLTPKPIGTIEWD